MLTYKSLSGLAILAESDWWLTNLSWVPSGFTNPWMLWLLMIPIVLTAWIWTRRSRAVALPLDHSSHQGGDVTRVLISLAETIMPIMLAIVIWILAGPMELGRPTTKRQVTNIQFCVDISGSMTASFGEGDRYEASMEAIDQFLEFREGDAFGLTFFGNEVLHWCPLTTDSSAIRCSVPFMHPRVAPGWFGGTEIGKALLACRKVLRDRDEGEKMIILVSDGSSSDLSGGAATEIAKRLSWEDITVYGIHIADYEVPDEIVQITTMTGGEVFNPGDPAALEGVFARIDQMEKAETEKTIAEQLDNYRPYCLLSLCFLGLASLCFYGLRYTPW